MAKQIGTVGHANHGKSSLIKALTGYDANELSTSEVPSTAIGHVELSPFGQVSILDVPDRQIFASNLLSGILGVDVALLCVASDEGIKPQTKEHLETIRLLPIQQLVVAITKSDLGSEEDIAARSAEISELLAPTRFKDSAIVPVSVETASGLERLKKELGLALAVQTNRGTPGGWFMPVDQSFSLEGYGTFATGTIARGSVNSETQVEIVPSGLSARIRRIEVLDEPVPTAEQGQWTTFNLGIVKAEELPRGTMIGAPGTIFETDIVDAEVEWVGRHKHLQKVRVAIGTQDVVAQALFESGSDQLVQFRFERPIATVRGLPLIIRQLSPAVLLGGGKVTVPVGQKRRKKDAQAKTQDTLAGAILEALQGESNGVMTEEICRRLRETPQKLGQAFELLAESRKIKGFAGLWFTTSEFENAVKAFVVALREVHGHYPTRAMVSRDTAVQRAKSGWSDKPLDRIVAELERRELIVVNGTLIRLKDFVVQLPERQRETMDRLKVFLESAGINTPPPGELAKKLNLPPQAAQDLLRLGLDTGEIMQLDEFVFYTPKQIEEFKTSIREISKGKQFATGWMRDAMKTTRKYIVPLLQYYDSIGFTVHVGENRMIKKG